MERTPRKSITPSSSVVVARSDSLSGWEALKSLSTLKNTFQNWRGRGGAGGRLARSYEPSRESTDNSGVSLLAPFPNPGRRGKSEFPA